MPADLPPLVDVVTVEAARLPPSPMDRAFSIVTLGGETISTAPRLDEALTATPGVLIEKGNLKDATDLARITNPTHQDAVAVALETAIEDTLLKPQYMTPSPEPPAVGSASASPSGKK